MNILIVTFGHIMSADTPAAFADQVVEASMHKGILKKRLGLPQSLYTILQVLRVTLFERMPLVRAITIVPDTTSEGRGL